MKRNIFHYLFLCAVSLVALTSCLGDVGNKYTLSTLMATVVDATATQVVVQIDATGLYYYADEFQGRDMEVGQRWLIEKMTVNNDEQPAGAIGAMTKPLKMTEVACTKVDTKYPLSQDDETLANDSVEMFYAPYINITKIGDLEKFYITFSGTVLKKADPEFRLVYTGTLKGNSSTVKDTVCYDFKAAYEKAGEKGEYASYVQSFHLTPLESEQVVKINFAGKRYQAAQETTITKSHCFVKAPKKLK
ncbi:MAG: hypothetical protein RR346_08765 [Bacteroidales bacterium]